MGHNRVQGIPNTGECRPQGVSSGNNKTREQRTPPIVLHIHIPGHLRQISLTLWPA